jgi:hypothetical protein
MNYSVCIVHKEYRWVEVEASTKEEAENRVWAMIDHGFLEDRKPEDADTELQTESVYA